MRTRSVAASLLILCAAASAPATSYWIAWEGDDWPENQGWTRSYGTFNNPGGGQAERTLSNGTLYIDGMQGIGVYDDYVLELPGVLNPGPGEQFVAHWRMRVEELSGGSGWDPIVAFFADDSWNVDFIYSYTQVWELATNRVVPIEPGVFHEYRFASNDMRTFQFSIDGTLVLIGNFDPGVLYSRAVWGDGATPSESRSTWDYVRFGVVPEPASLGSALALGIAAVPRRSRRVAC